MQCHTRACANVLVWLRVYTGWDGCGGRRSGAFSRSGRLQPCTVTLLESDSAGPSATVTEVSRSEIWWCWSQRVNSVEDYRRSE